MGYCGIQSAKNIGENVLAVFLSMLYMCAT